MKLGVILEGETIESLAAQALAAETAGIDIAWLPVEADGDTAMIRAAAVATRTSVIRLAACAPADGHPLEIAEAAAVADNVSNGRLIVVLQDAQGDEACWRRPRRSCSPRSRRGPFRHDGPRWKIPGNLPENEQQEERIIVTPQAVQPELPVWLAGRAAPVVARDARPGQRVLGGRIGAGGTGSLGAGRGGTWAGGAAPTPSLAAPGECRRGRLVRR